MTIELTSLGKRYNREWIFRNLTFRFTPGKQYAIIGPNGSGKSTLLQVIAGATIHNEGSVAYNFPGKVIEPGKIYSMISFSAPYLDLVEEMTLLEFLNFHNNMKGWLSPLCTKDIILLLTLQSSAHKQLRYFSSGMKQRVKLAQAIFSDVPAVLLDEPATNLDEEGIRLYKTLVETYCKDRLVIVSSNDKEEYSFCGECIDMMNYK